MKYRFILYINSNLQPTIALHSPVNNSEFKNTYFNVSTMILQVLDLYT